MSRLTHMGLAPGQARLNITWQGQNGDLPDPVQADASDLQILAWAQEALQSGSVPGIQADRRADLSDFMVDRFPPNNARPFAMLLIRPKTPFGA